MTERPVLEIPEDGIVVVEAAYYEHLTEPLVASATAQLENLGRSVVRVPVIGSLEIAPAIVLLDRAFSRKIAGFLAVGCILRGETAHFEWVVQETARALTELEIRRELLIGKAVLAADTVEHIRNRSGGQSSRDRGAEAARALMALIDLRDTLPEPVS